MSPRDTPDVSMPDSSSTSISAAAHTYQLAMSQQSATPTSAASPATQIPDSTRDVVMNDSAFDLPASPAPALHGSANAPSPLPPRTGTPVRNTNGNDVTSRATSQHPDTASIIPSEAPPHGAPTRQYLNSKVTGVLLEGMKQLAKEQPRDPLRALGEYLLQRSKELEGN